MSTSTVSTDTTHHAADDIPGGAMQPPVADPPLMTELLGLADLTTPMCVRVAATLRLADKIIDGHDDITSLAEATDSDPRGLGAVVDHLVQVGVLDHDDRQRLTLTPLGDQLRSPLVLATILDLEGPCGRFDLAMTGLLHTVRTGDPSYPQMFGAGYWADVSDDPELAAACGALQAPRLQFDADLIIDGPAWASWSSFLDLGGANGALAGQLLQAHSHLRGGVLDLPNIVDNARPVLRSAGVEDRCVLHPGSFFDEIPPGYDTYLLSAILWDWNDDEVVSILRRTAAAAGPDGTVLVGEISMDEAARPSELALRMITTVPGVQRDPGSVIALAARAGLTLAAPLQTAPQRYLLQFRNVDSPSPA